MTDPQRRAAEPDASVWVSASAGTGKTKVLTDRVLRLLLAGVPPENILCLTFTRAAAAEMALRVAQRLAQWAIADEAKLADDLRALIGTLPTEAACANARLLFAQVLDAPGGLSIQTIHAFSQSLLRRFPIEAGITPHFDIADERTSAELFGAARARLLAGVQESSDARFSDAFSVVTGLIGEAEFDGVMAAVGEQRSRVVELLDRHGGVEPLVSAIREAVVGSDTRTADDIAEAGAHDSAFDGAGLAAAVAVMAEGKTSDRARAAKIKAWLDAPVSERVANLADYGGAFWRDGAAIDRLATKQVLADTPALDTTLRAEQARLGVLLEAWQRAGVAESTAALLRVSDHLLGLYDREKARIAALDYDDQIEITRRLLAQPDVAPWVLFKLDGGLDHVLIDEAQDTSPAQWAIIAALIEEFFAGEGARETTRSLFVVGDEKQSIFSFQGADPRALDDMRRFFERRVRGAARVWDTVPLTVSFRSTKAVLDIVDTVFAADHMRQAVTSDDAPVRHLVHRKGQGGLVECWALVESRGADAPEPWEPPRTRPPRDDPAAELAQQIARRIKAWMTDPREPGAWLDSQDRRVRPGDIMVLVRRRTEFVDHLVRALKTLDIPVAGIDRMIVTEQLAVMDLMQLGAFVLLPGDDLALATVLKSPLIGLHEDQLFAIAHDRGARDLWQMLAKRRSDDPAFDRAYQRLAGWLRLADTVPPFEFYTTVLSADGGRAALLSRLGPEAADPIDEFLAIALAYERAHVPSLQGFLHWIERGRTEIKRDLEQGRDEVRIMTVHGAKGLQAPIVFLPDTTQKPTDAPALLWLEERQPDAPPSLTGFLWPGRRRRDDPTSRAARQAARDAQEAEYRRLLYVAMTRAADRLYVCGWRGKKKPSADCWYNLIRDSLEQASDCAEIIDRSEVRGLRYHEPQAAPPEETREDAPAQTELVLLPAELRTDPAPEVAPPRRFAPSRGADPPTVRSPLAPSGGSALARGRLVHALLERLPPLAPDARPAAAEAFLAHHGLGVHEHSALARAVVALMSDPTIAPLFGGDGLAEAPILAVVGDRTLTGQIDRLLVHDDVVIALDFKTGRVPPADETSVPTPYLDQMAHYREALAAAFPGRTVRCGLLFTDGPKLIWLSPEALETRSP